MQSQPPGRRGPAAVVIVFSRVEAGPEGAAQWPRASQLGAAPLVHLGSELASVGQARRPQLRLDAGGPVVLEVALMDKGAHEQLKSGLKLHQTIVLEAVEHISVKVAPAIRCEDHRGR